MTLYMAGARMVHYYPVSIPAHGVALNITVHSYGDLLEFGLTACRRVLSQPESYELVRYLKAALKEIEALPSIDAAAAAAAASEPAQPKPKSAAGANGAIEKAAPKAKPPRAASATRKTASPRRAAAANGAQR